MKINIKSSAGADKSVVTCSPDNTVAELKGIVQAVTQVPAEQQRLIFKGHVLKDAQTLKELGECRQISARPREALSKEALARIPVWWSQRGKHTRGRRTIQHLQAWRMM